MPTCLLECYSNYKFTKTTVFNNFNVPNLIMEGVTLIRKHSIYFFRVAKLFYICHFTCASQEPSMTDRWRNVISFLKIILSVYLFMTMLGLHCCTGFSLVAADGGYSAVAACRRLTAMGSLAVEHGF